VLIIGQLFIIKNHYFCVADTMIFDRMESIMNVIINILKDKSFLSKTFMIAIPIALQNLLNNILNTVDTLMIGRLGEASVAAVGLANKVFFVFILLMFGISSGSSVLASQYYGRHELLNIKRVLRITLLVGISASFLFVIPAILCPEYVMRIFTPDADAIKIGAEYLRVIAISYPLTAFSMGYTVILRSMNFVRYPVLITLISICVNIVLNYGFIFGKLGMPELGVAGAALATLIARVVEACLILIIVRLQKTGDNGVGDFVHLKIEKAKDKASAFLHPEFIKKYIYTAAPVIANEFMWGLGITMYSLVYGRMGNTATAAITINGNVENLSLVLFFGLCNAAAVVLGNEMGADELKKAEEHAKSYMVLLFVLTLVGAALTYTLKEPIIQWFKMPDSVNEYIRLCLTVFVLSMPVRMLNCIIIIAILRSGGDTRAALFIDVSSVWLIGIPMAVLGGIILELPIYLVYAMISLEEVYKFTLGFIRYKKKKWLKNIAAD
jgi:putative MATE family efflux protein